jgi:hypothetical protein
VLAIVIHKRLETDALDEPLRGLLVDFQADCIYNSLGGRLGRQVFLRSNDDVFSPDGAVQLNLSP